MLNPDFTDVLQTVGQSGRPDMYVNLVPTHAATCIRKVLYNTVRD
jgi:hypothetical protein